MDQSFTIEITEVPIAGGLTEDPSVLRSVNDFLGKPAHHRKVDQLLQEDGCVTQYWSLIDCLLVELAPQFKDACLEFYQGKGQPLASLHPAEAIAGTDAELGLALEVLVSHEWSTWEDFKSNYKRRTEWEPL